MNSIQKLMINCTWFSLALRVRASLDIEIRMADAEGATVPAVYGEAANAGGEPAEGQAAAPAPQRSWMDFARTMIFQMVIFYFISSYFRGGKTPPPESLGPDGKPLPMAGTNLFRKGQELVIALCSSSAHKAWLCT